MLVNVKSILVNSFKGFSLGVDRFIDGNESTNEFRESVSMSCLNRILLLSIGRELFSVNLSSNSVKGDISTS